MTGRVPGRRANMSLLVGGKPHGSGIYRLDHQARGRLEGNPGCTGAPKLLTLACPSKYPSSDREVSSVSSSSLACSVPGCAPRAVSFVASCVLLFESCVRAVACGRVLPLAWHVVRIVFYPRRCMVASCGWHGGRAPMRMHLKYRICERPQGHKHMPTRKAQAS